MTSRLYINEKLMDMLPSERPSWTFQVNDLHDISTREASKSNKFRLPKTRTNIENLEMSESVNSTSRIPYQKSPCKYVSEGIERIGYAIIEQSDDYFNVTIYSGNYNFFNAIEGKKLRDLPLSTWNHLWDLTTIASYKSATSGLVYPIVAYTEDPAYINSSSNDVDVRRLLPMFFVHTLVRLIIQEAGFTLPSGSFLDTNPFVQKLLLSVGSDRWDMAGLILRAESTIRQYNGLAPVLIFDDDSSGSASDFTGNFDIGNIWQPGFTGNPDTLIVPATPFSSGGFYVRLKNINLTIGSGDSSIGATFSLNCVVVRATVIVNQIRIREWRINTANTNQVITGDFEAPIENVQAGDILYFQVSYSNYNPGVHLPGWSLAIGATIEAEYLSDAPIAFGGPVDIATNMPDMTQKDFMKGIAQLMAVSLSPDSEGVEFGHKPLLQVALDTAIAIDITEYIDAKDLKNATVNYRFGRYGQKNWMKYKEDDGVIKGFGDHYFIVFDEVLEKEVTLFTLPFGASQSMTFNTNLDIPKIKRWDDDGNLKLKTTPRILLYDDRDIYTDSVNLTDGTSSVLLTNSNPIPYAHFINANATVNLAFHNSIIKDWYQPLVVMLENAKKITVRSMLPATFIENMDQLVPVYIKPLHEFFYMNKITGWDGKSKESIELIRITGVNAYADVIPRPELILENEFNGTSPWTLVDSTSSGALAITGGEMVLTMPAYPGAGIAVTIDEWLEQDISGLVPGDPYRLRIMTGDIDPYFNALRVGPGTPHAIIQIGFETPIVFTLPAPLQSNYLYEFIINPTSSSPPDNTVFFQVSVSHDAADTAFAGGEKLKIKWVSLMKV